MEAQRTPGKHVAFVNVPATGHVNPTLAPVAELVRRGHRVTYAVGARMADAVAATGATPLVLPTELHAQPPGGGSSLDAFLALLRFLVDDARESLPLLLDHFRADPPDVVGFDAMLPHGEMLAEALGRPSITTYATFASNEHLALDDVMRGRPVLPDVTLTAYAEDLAELAARFGVAAPTVPLQPVRPASLTLVFLPRRFQPRQETFDERYRFVGPQIGDRADDPWRPRDPDAPLLYIALGTVFSDRPDFYRSCLRAFGDTRWQVALSVGAHVDPTALGTIPGNVDVRPSFPQPAVLAHATAFVSHAGMNSVMESLSAGVPLVGVPQMHEQAANAGRVEELGLGRRLDPVALTESRLRDTVEAVGADPAIRANLAAMREEIRRSGGPTAAADAIEGLLGG